MNEDEVLNPVSIERSIRETANDISRGVRVVSEAEQEYRAKARAYDRAFAAAYLAADGPQYEKRYHAELDTQDERDAMDVAELAFKHAERTAKSLEAKLRAFQSVGASVRQMYGATS